MLAADNRLRKQNDFDRLYQTGRTISGPLFNVRWVNNGLADSRFGVVVSKNTAKLATRRNRIKRKVRAGLKGFLVGIKGGLDIVIIIKRPALDKEYTEIKEELGKIFKKARLLK
ncbi:MAG: ribonuclease P protein component [Candidatus Doudnabacteria bacterium RIFCSPHIGHO2_02_FULL_46_11]|uniref:Ribonuclease P protein component n=1 Tax=Candidatus Doudnabacteria bacterium RIFCSPHIGHO2_02_FULL_46_11 TaxID=1817832 RepID=A0A1F5P863_9BACT|nr:MAG: ribonuclease P protein component [Candidatus Doudnabacteria bacterium RIFCSPHIGHO2_02_FULL_46_11]